MSESRVCPECGAEVPAGRLSCGACGALLASVHGRVTTETPGVPTAPETANATGPGDPSDWDASPAPDPADMPGAPARQPSSPALERIVPPPPPMPPLPGGYLPPSSMTRGAPGTPLMAAVTPASSLGSRPRALGPSSVPGATPASRPGGPEPPPPSPGPGVTPALPARAPVLELPFAIAPGLGPRLVAAGAALGVLAFVLPWISGGGVLVGAAFGTGYFATWGLAAVGNVLPFLLAWLSLGLALLPNRVPRYASVGILPLVLGGVLAGYGWTYVIAPYGIGIGIWALAGAALLLVAGGSLVVRRDRVAG